MERKEGRQFKECLIALQIDFIHVSIKSVSEKENATYWSTDGRERFPRFLNRHICSKTCLLLGQKTDQVADLKSTIFHQIIVRRVEIQSY